jgi:choice-of-anchor A domain-containing protein
MKKLIGFCTLIGLLWSAAAAAQTEKTWTLDGEFDTGVLDSVNHDAPNNHQLQLNTSSSTEPYIWIANFEMGTVTKIDTRTGKQVARYDSVLVKNWDGSVPAVKAPRGNCNSPSRTAVDGNGNAFVANRGICADSSASVTKYAGTLSACVDRNGNNTIDTSKDVNNDGLIDLNSTAEYKGQADECILWTKNYAAPGDWGRSAAVDADQNLWVGGYHSSKLYKLNGNTGALLKTIDPRANPQHYASYIYGIAIGPGGFIYTSDIENRYILKINPNAAAGQEVVGMLRSPVPTYGIAVDKNSVVWLGNWSDVLASVVRVDFANNTATLHGGSQGNCQGRTRGVAVDKNGDVWTSCFSGSRLLRFNSAGTYLGSWPVGSGPVGAAVDGDGKIWTINLNGNSATRFDPATTGLQSFPVSGTPYSYSDMTGFQQRNFTQRQGDWTVIHDSGNTASIWGPVHWNRESQGSVPAGTTITVEVRTANTQADLANQPYIPVTNGQAVPNLTGRFIEVKATLRIQNGNVSPILSDLSVSFSLPPPPPPEDCIEIRLSDYNLFLLEDYNDGRDVQGKVAVGGTANLVDFSAGWLLPATDISNVLVVGGQLNITRSAIYGDARYGAGYTEGAGVTYLRGGAVAQGTPVNFTQRGAHMRETSSRLAALPANGTTTIESWGGIMLSGTDPSLNVFNVNASAFGTAVLLSIDAPAGSLAVINIHGTTASFSNFGHTTSGGISANGILYNFVDATTINATNYGFYGTLLAPYAHLNFTSGAWDGGLFAKSMTGDAEGHITPLPDRDICEED